jgi:ABC-type glycerol-3-phosphate transport system substrate-binding protein
MQTNWNWLPIFSKNGEGFYDLNKMKDVIDLSQFDAKELQSTTVDGKLNGIRFPSPRACSTSTTRPGKSRRRVPENLGRADGGG